MLCVVCLLVVLCSVCVVLLLVDCCLSFVVRWSFRGFLVWCVCDYGPVFIDSRVLLLVVYVFVFCLLVHA